MKFIFAVDLPRGLAIPTANRLFRPSQRGGKLHLYKDPKAVTFQAYLVGSFAKQPAVQKIRAIHAAYPLLLAVSLQFTFVKRFFLRDASNAIKATEDALVTVLGIDDSQFVAIGGRKVSAPPQTRRERVVVDVTLFARDHQCQCGCQAIAQIVGRTDRTRGLVAWTPYRFNPGHHPTYGQTTEPSRHSA